MFKCWEFERVINQIFKTMQKISTKAIDNKVAVASCKLANLKLTTYVIRQGNDMKTMRQGSVPITQYNTMSR